MQPPCRQLSAGGGSLRRLAVPVPSPGTRTPIGSWWRPSSSGPSWAGLVRRHSDLTFPTLQHVFHASLGAVTWVGLSYLLVLVATVTAVGRLAGGATAGARDPDHRAGARRCRPWPLHAAQQRGDHVGGTEAAVGRRLGVLNMTRGLGTGARSRAHRALLRPGLVARRGPSLRDGPPGHGVGGGRTSRRLAGQAGSRRRLVRLALGPCGPRGAQ